MKDGCTYRVYDDGAENRTSDCLTIFGVLGRAHYRVRSTLLMKNGSAYLITFMPVLVAILDTAGLNDPARVYS